LQADKQQGFSPIVFRKYVVQRRRSRTSNRKKVEEKAALKERGLLRALDWGGSEERKKRKKWRDQRRPDQTGQSAGVGLGANKLARMGRGGNSPGARVSTKE